MTATAETIAEHPQQRPIDRLQKVLGDLGERQFTTTSYKIFLYRWENFRGYRDEIDEFSKKRHSQEIYVIITDHSTEIGKPPNETEGTAEVIEINSHQIFVDTPEGRKIKLTYRSRIGNIETEPEETGILVKSEEPWAGQEYDKVIKLILNALPGRRSY